MKIFLSKIPAVLFQGALACIIVSSLPVFVFAASFDIKPVRLELSSETPLEKLVIRNVSDKEFPLQVRVYEWNQNEKGEDVYTETEDIIAFPKIMTIKRDEERYIRVGSKVVPGTAEKTYRIYVEELPDGSAAPKEGANIRMYMKVGIPIFIRPARPESRMIIEDASMTGGTMKLKLKNSGNVHSIVTNIHIQGFDGANTAPFDRNIGGWYLLKGTEKIYTTQVPPEVCGSIKSYSIEIKTRDETLTKQLPALGTTCGEVAETAETR